MFPLPLNSIERFHFFDDSPEFPNNFFGRICLEGELNSEHLTNAFQIVSRRHVWGDVVARKVAGRWKWIQQPGQTPELIIRNAELETYPPLEPTQACPARFVAVLHASGSSVTVQAHHAMSDGLGGMHFLADWMVVYDNLVHGRIAEDGLPQLNPQLLTKRGAIGLRTWRYWKHFWKQPIALFGAAKFLFRRFATLGTQSSPTQGTGEGPPLGFPQILGSEIPREQLLKIRAALVQNKIKLNDYLAATLFQSLAHHVNRNQTQQCLRMIIPMSIRERGDILMPAANRTTLVQIDRFSHQVADAVPLAQGIQFELGVIRGWYLDRLFLLIIRMISISDTWLKQSVTRRKPRATTLFTNLGKPFLKLRLPRKGRKFCCGGLVVSSIELAAPIRSQLPISFTSLEYGGDLFLNAHVDSRFLSTRDAEQLIREWSERIVAIVK